MGMNKKERKIVEELKSASTLYNHWDITSMRMALWDIQRKVKELIKVGDKNGR